MKDAKPRELILKEISDDLSKYAPFKTVDQILLRFLDEMRTLT